MSLFNWYEKKLQLTARALPVERRGWEERFKKE